MFHTIRICYWIWDTVNHFQSGRFLKMSWFIVIGKINNSNQLAWCLMPRWLSKWENPAINWPYLTKFVLFFDLINKFLEIKLTTSFATIFYFCVIVFSFFLVLELFFASICLNLAYILLFFSFCVLFFFFLSLSLFWFLFPF